MEVILGVLPNVKQHSDYSSKSKKNEISISDNSVLIAGNYVVRYGEGIRVFKTDGRAIPGTFCFIDDCGIFIDNLIKTEDDDDRYIEFEDIAQVGLATKDMHGFKLERVEGYQVQNGFSIEQNNESYICGDTISVKLKGVFSGFKTLTGVLTVIDEKYLMLDNSIVINYKDIKVLNMINPRKILE